MAAIRGRFFVAAIIAVIVPLMTSLAITVDLFHDFGFDVSFDASLALAGVLSLTSMGVLAKVLIDNGRLRDQVGIEMFTTALIAELLLLLLVGLTLGEHSHDLSVGGVLVLLGQIAGFIVVTWVLAARVIPPLIELLERLLRAGASLGAVVARLDMPFTIVSGLMAKGVAEIAALLVLLEHGVIGQAVFSLFVITMLAYILLAPPVIGFAVSRSTMLRYLPKHAWSDTPLSKIAREATPNTWPDDAVEDVLELITAEARGGQ